MTAIADFFQRHGAIRLSPQRERFLRLPLAELESLRDDTQRLLPSLTGPVRSAAETRLRDLEAVIGSMQHGERIRQQREQQAAQDRETTRRAEALVADLRKIDLDGMQTARRVLAEMRCSDPVESVVLCKVRAMLAGS